MMRTFALALLAAAIWWQLGNRIDALDQRIARLPLHAVESIAASKHAWPSLSDAEGAALAKVLATLPKTTKFDIVCNDVGCTDLAMDIDDAMEQAGLDSVLDHALGPLGYGIAIRVNPFDRTAADAASAALKRATSGRIDIPVTEAPANTNPAGYVTILIGKYRAPEPR